MSIFSSSPSADSSDADPRPVGQRERADNAHLNPNDPAKDAEAGTPHYGTFGTVEDVDNPTPAATNSSRNDGSNDNPDEFSEFRKPNESKTENHATDSADANPDQQRGHVTQNKNPDSVQAAQNKDVDVQHTAWADDDERYAGGHAKASWTEENEKEHDDN